MGINLSSIVSKNKVLSKVDNIVDSWLGKDTKEIYDKAPIYSVPSNIASRPESTYMLITIYDNDSNNVQFLPMEAEKASSDILKRIKGAVNVKFSDKWKKGLKNYSKTVLNNLKELIKSNLGFDFGKWEDTVVGGWYGDIKDSLKWTSDWLERNLSASALLDDIGIGDWLTGLGSPIELSIDTDELKSLAQDKIEEYASKNKITKALYKKYFDKNGDPQYQRIEDPAESGYNIKASVALTLPTEDIVYSSSIGIEAKETKTAAAVKSIVDKSASKYDASREGGSSMLSALISSISAGVGQTSSVFKDAGQEMLFSTFLGEGGTALFQNKNQQIRDPLYVYMYSAPSNRSFTFKYVFAPTNKDELFQIYNTIKLLRFYGAVQASRSDKSGIVRYYNLPGRFRIQFYTNDHENIWFGKTKLMGLSDIKTSIPLENIALISNDFDDSGNPPKVIELEMTFKELSIITREDINGGY